MDYSLNTEIIFAIIGFNNPKEVIKVISFFINSKPDCTRKVLEKLVSDVKLIDKLTNYKILTVNNGKYFFNKDKIPELIEQTFEDEPIYFLQ